MKRRRHRISDDRQLPPPPRDNSGGLPSTKVVTLQREMAAFDSLPEPLRRFLDERSRFRLSAAHIRDSIPSLSQEQAEQVLQWLQEDEGEMHEQLRIVR